MWTTGQGFPAVTSPTAVRDGYITWWVRRQGELENLELVDELITTRLQYFLVMCVYARVQQVREFSTRWFPAECFFFLLFSCILFACFLPFEDRVLALHVRPAQWTVSQIPNDHWQLADLTTRNKNKIKPLIQTWGGNNVLEPTVGVPRLGSASWSHGLSAWPYEASCSPCRSQWWCQTPPRSHPSWHSACQLSPMSRPLCARHHFLSWHQLVRSGREDRQPGSGTTMWKVRGHLHSSLTKGTNSWFELRGSTEHLYGATLAGKLKYCQK